VFEGRILGFHGLQGFDHIIGLTAQPDLLFYAILQHGESGRRPGRTPGSTLGIHVAHEAKGSKPFVTLVMVGTQATDSLFLATGEVKSALPCQVLA
jgi:hypothetical protein